MEFKAIPMIAALLHNMIFIQAIGFLAFGAGVLAFIQKDDRKLKIIQIQQCALLAIHFALLGSNGAVITAAVSSLRNVASLNGKNKILAPLFIAAYIGLGIWRYEVWADALPIIGAVAVTYGFFYLSKVPMRFCILFASSLWIIHNIIVVSIGPLFMELMISGATLYTIISMTKENKKPDQ